VVMSVMRGVLLVQYMLNYGWIKKRAIKNEHKWNWEWRMMEWFDRFCIETMRIV
jgi:hypothetical protein